MASSSQVRRSRREQLEAQRLAQAEKERRNRILFFAVGLVVLALVVGLAVWGVVAATNQGGNDIPPNANSAKNGIYFGQENVGAPTLEVYSDYNCSACRSAHLTLHSLLEQAVKDGKLNVLLHIMSFEGATSRDAAVAATCSDFQGKFVDFHNQLYINQSSSGFGTTMLQETIPAVVDLTGDDLAAFQSCATNQATGSFVDAMAAYASKNGVTSTPTFIFDGEKINEQIWNTNTGTYDPDLLRELFGL